MDLPTTESRETAHRQEVDRLVKKVDLFVWVLDTEKCATPGVTTGVRSPACRRDAGRADQGPATGSVPSNCRHVLAELRRTWSWRSKLLATSAVTGQGVGELHLLTDEHCAAQRLGFDITRAASELAGQVGDAPAAEVSPGPRQAAEQVAGAGRGCRPGEGAQGLRGSLATGWPLVKWIARFRPDPLRRLHLDRFELQAPRTELEPVFRVQRTSLPRGNQVARSRVDSAVRALSDEAAPGLAGRRAARLPQQRRHPGRLRPRDRHHRPGDRHALGWWRAIRVFQWILTVAVLGGLLWLLGDVLLAYFQLPPLPAVRWPAGCHCPRAGHRRRAGPGCCWRWSAAVSWSCRPCQGGSCGAGAGRRGRRVAQRMVVDPVDAELARYPDGPGRPACPDLNRSCPPVAGPPGVIARTPA